MKTFAVKDPNTGKITKIAYMDDEGNFQWSNKIARVLPNEMKIIHMDDYEEGIETVGDIRKKINEFGFFS